VRKSFIVLSENREQLGTGIYILALRTEREGKEEGKEIDGIGGRRGDVDHARVFVLRE